jgi:hypothetical protein
MSSRPRTDTSDAHRVRIPADVDRPDRILAGLTARQLALLAVPAVAVWAVYLGVRRWVPLPLFAALVAPLVIGVVTIAVGQRDGVSLDRLLMAALAHWRSPQRLVPAPDGVHTPPAWAGHDTSSAPAPLTLPARGIMNSGVIDVGDDGAVVLARVAPVNFALRTPTEQQALIGGFARYLNSLTVSVQILIRSTPVDLIGTIEGLRMAAGGLPHPALEAAAREHASYLEDLAASRDLLTREVLLVLRDPGPDTGAADRLHRMVGDATAALAGCGLTVTTLGADEAATVFASAIDPWAPPRPDAMAAPDAIITATGNPA